MIFENRFEAGKILAKKLFELKFKNDHIIVVSIPRGGVIIGFEIAKKLKIPHTILVIKKIAAPHNKELAIGATATFGKPVLDRWLIGDLDVSKDYLGREIAARKKEAKMREKMLGIEISPNKFKGKTVIVADDGIATGQTVKMAARILKQFGVLKMILAVGCMPSSVQEEFKKEFDKIVCPAIREDFMAVGQFYKDFAPVADSDVKKLLLKH